MKELLVNWIKKDNDMKWHNLVELEKNSLDYNGVYIIWYPKGRMLKIGSGNIKERLEKHSNENGDFYKSLIEFNKKNNTQYKLKDLLVTFAKVNGNQMEGVEAYLADKYKALLPEETAIRFPNKEKIKVNTPFKI